jgi:3D (Asp-Asp-Asp) domain-containing protein
VRRFASTAVDLPKMWRIASSPAIDLRPGELPRWRKRFPNHRLLINLSRLKPEPVRRTCAAAIALAALLGAGACADRRPAPVTAPVRTDAFVATAYCRGTITAAGTRVREGIVAADPAVLPMGTVIRVGGLGQRYNRIYHVLDTGRAVRGRQIDVYVSNCAEAIEFGRRPAVVSVIPAGVARTR